MQTSQPMNTVLVDDSDPSIHYGPGWVNKPSLLAQSDPNYPMYGTLHETVNQTDLTYSFPGSTVTACGIVASGNVSQLHNLNSLWTCSVDRVQIDTFVDYTFLLGASICCTLGTQLNGQVQHEIHISATGSQNTPISFDYLTYETSFAMPVADLIIFPEDSKFRNIEGWEVQREVVTSNEIEVMVTTQPNANITFDFYGSLILWFGFYNTTFSDSVVGRFTYSVDNTGAWNMGLEPLAVKTALNGSISAVQVLLFPTFALPHGQHRLEVNYTSDPSQKCIPLTLTQLVVQNGTINPNSSVPTTTPTPSAPPSARTNGSQRLHLAIILGCCGAAVLALVILGIFCAHRRVKRRRDRASAEKFPSIIIEPFSYNPASAPVGTHQKGQRPSEVQEQGVVETADVQVEAPPSYVAEPHDS